MPALSPTLRLRLASVALVLALVAPAGALAAGPQGGALNMPGDRSHNVSIGWPEFTYSYEGLVQDRTSVALRVGLQIWPLSLGVGPDLRFTLLEQGRVALAFRLNPSFNAAFFGGSRATYPKNFAFGRSRTFRFSLGPGVNLGLAASIDVKPGIRVIAAFENPLALWIWTAPTAWWVEWPVTFAAGAEFDAGYKTTFWGRIGGGPSLAFTGPNALLGFHWHIVVGAQFRILGPGG